MRSIGWSRAPRPRALGPLPLQEIPGHVDVVAPGPARIHHRPDRLKQFLRPEPFDERAEPALAALQKLARQSQGGRDQENRREGSRPISVAEHDRPLMTIRPAVGHEREERRTHPRHVGRDEDGIFATNVLEPDPGARERPLVCDLIAHEARAIGPLGKRRLGSVRREDDHDVLAGIEKCAQRPVEERCAIEGLDQLRAAKASRGAAREQDPGRAAHAREISTTAL